MPCRESIKVIKEAGGIPVLAHPYLLKLKSEKLKKFVRMLKSIGIEGIEVFYPEHTEEETKLFSEIAEEFKLKITGGTDFHGTIKPWIKMGTGKNNLFIPFDLYRKLKCPIK